MGLEKAASGVRAGDGMLLRLGPFFRHVHFPAVCNSILLFSLLVAVHELSSNDRYHVLIELRRYPFPPPPSILYHQCL